MPFRQMKAGRVQMQMQMQMRLVLADPPGKWHLLCVLDHSDGIACSRRNTPMTNPSNSLTDSAAPLTVVLTSNLEGTLKRLRVGVVELREEGQHDLTTLEGWDPSASLKGTNWNRLSCHAPVAIQQQYSTCGSGHAGTSTWTQAN